MADKKKYDSTVARIAGNIAGHILTDQAWGRRVDLVARDSVALARAIVAEVERTEKVAESGPETGDRTP